MNESTQNTSTNPLEDFLNETENTTNPPESTEATVEKAFNPFEQKDAQTTEKASTSEATPEETQKPEAETKTETNVETAAEQQTIDSASKPESKPKETKSEATVDPFAAALQKAQIGSEQRLIETLTEKPPVFSYTTAKEAITDSEKTFDALRQQYETDFPELSEKKKVTWSVTYGKVVKSVPNPEGTKVYEFKAEIEKSKPFLDTIKKAKTDKNKNPECIVTPRVTAQSKGETASSYKGIFPTLEEAVRNPKPIMLVPSRDGKVYEIRRNKIGTFITPAVFCTNHNKRGSVMEPLLPQDGPKELSYILPGFAFHLPKIPYSILKNVIGLFRHYAKEKLEVLVHILYNKTDGEYRLHIPKQTVTATSVDVTDAEELPEDCLHVMDIHSHHRMAAKFSLTDDNDEKATGIYAVIGRTDKLFPDIRVRISNGGKFLEIDAREVFENNDEVFLSAPWNDEMIIKADMVKAGDKP